MTSDCEFLFAALAEKHNAVICKIREIPPWEWGVEFLALEPQVLRFLGTFAKQYPECAASKTAYTLAASATIRVAAAWSSTQQKQRRQSKTKTPAIRAGVFVLLWQRLIS